MDRGAKVPRAGDDDHHQRVPNCDHVLHDQWVGVYDHLRGENEGIWQETGRFGDCDYYREPVYKVEILEIVWLILVDLNN